MKLLSLFSFSLIFLKASFLYAAACCGGGFAAPTLIVGDDKAQMTTSYSFAQINTDVSTYSLWAKREDPETSETLRLDYAQLISDRTQLGISLPVIRRSLMDESEFGLGDTSLNWGYEYLPDWDYNPWRPKGLGYLQIILPTGRPIQESETTAKLDARGRGFWALGLGTVLTKNFGKWDFYANFEAHKAFERSYENSQGQGALQPGYGGSWGLGAGYSINKFRIGSSATWNYEDPIDVTGTTASQGVLQRYATATISVSQLLKDNFTASLSYSDQKLLGSPLNTSLSQSVMVFIQKRWLR